MYLDFVGEIPTVTAKPYHNPLIKSARTCSDTVSEGPYYQPIPCFFLSFWFARQYADSLVLVELTALETLCFHRLNSTDMLHAHNL